MAATKKVEAKVRACVVLPPQVDRDLEAMAVVTGESKSRIVERGIALVHSALSERSRAAVERVRGIVDARADAPSNQGAA
jgi:hypothetical protein